MNDIKKYIDIIKLKSAKVVSSATDHRFILIVIIVSFAMALALFRTKSYLNIPRNDAKYQAEVSQINYKQIDKTILAEFQTAEQDKNVEVNSNFNPDRKNPFSE